MTYKDTVQFRQIQKVFMITLQEVNKFPKFPLLFRQKQEKTKYQKQPVLPVRMEFSQGF